jgi:hypothetical protein
MNRDSSIVPRRRRLPSSRVLDRVQQTANVSVLRTAARKIEFKRRVGLCTHRGPKDTRVHYFILKKEYGECFTRLVKLCRCNRCLRSYVVNRLDQDDEESSSPASRELDRLLKTASVGILKLATKNITFQRRIGHCTHRGATDTRAHYFILKHEYGDRFTRRTNLHWCSNCDRSYVVIVRRRTNNNNNA